MQRHVLTMLALRLNWKTGAGYASTGQLMTDSDASESTVRRASSWARKKELLIQTRRGHRLGNGERVASEWKLSLPVTGDLLSESQPVNGQTSTGQNGHLNRSVGMHHQELSSSITSSSDPARHTSAPRSEACKTKNHDGCGYAWCKCFCHTSKPKRERLDDAQPLDAILAGVAARTAGP